MASDTQSASSEAEMLQPLSPLVAEHFSTGYDRLIQKLASLEKFQRTLRESQTTEESIRRGLEEVGRLIRFRVYGFYLVAEAGDFMLSSAEPAEQAPFLEEIVSTEIERGTFAWALRHTRPIIVQSPASGQQILLSALTTPARILGMFVGVLEDQDVRSAEDVQGLLSLMLLGVTYTIENHQLLSELRAYNDHLQELVDQRTAEIVKANAEVIKVNRGLQQEIEERQRREEELRHAKAAAEQAGRAKSEFLAVMSHEIRTPMSGVIGFANLLEGTNLDEEQLELVQQINVSGEQLVSLLNDLLDFSKIEAGRLHLERHTIKLRDLIAIQVKFIAARCWEKGVEVSFDVADDVPETYMGDSTRLRQIVTNLLNNALKFTDQGEITLRVSVEQSPDDPLVRHLLWSVQDTGIGIATDKIDRLFKPFSQADSSTNRRYGGTGLGLAICQKLCELMGGQIRVDSKYGEGSNFSFTLPLPAPDQESASNQVEVPKFNGRVACIVSSRANQRSILNQQLTRWGVKVEETDSDLATILNLPRPAVIDGLIIDADPLLSQMIPVVQQIRQLQPSMGTIVFCQTRAQRDEVDALHDPMLHCLLKPIAPDVLAKSLSTIWDKSLPGDSPSRATPESKPPEIEVPVVPLQILVVDDNGTNLRIGSQILQGLGHTVHQASSGAIAIQKITENDYDLVLLDINMPDMDGLQVGQLLRSGQAGERGRQVYISAWTALATVENRAACQEIGMNEFLTKPLNMSELKRVLAICAARVCEARATAA